MNIEILRYKQRLGELFGRTKSLGDDLELQAHWARYLCVLSCGFLETSIRAILEDLVLAQSSPLVASYVSKRLGYFRNPKMNRIIDLLSDFNTEKAQELKKTTEGDLKSAIDSIVENRNKIAHGESVGITFSRIKDYHGRAEIVIDLIARAFPT